jgi:nucleotide-binding universal stress UspA family protein
MLARVLEAIHAKAGGVTLIGAATDFTAAGTAAVRRAALLAKTHNARVALLHVSTPASRMMTKVLDAFGSSSRSNRGTVLSNLRETAARVTTAFGVPVEIHMTSGNLPDAIATLAQAAEAELIVLGNSKASFLAELILKNTARQVKRKTFVPVLAVSRAAQSSYRRVLLAGDPSPVTVHSEHVSRRFFPGAMLTVLHAFEPPYEDMLALADVSREVIEEHRSRAAHEASERLRLFSREAAFDKNSMLEVRIGKPAACLRKRVRELDADVLVVRPLESRRELELASDVAEQLLADPPCDMLLLG